MDKVILLRYGEIFLKGNNRKYFEKLLLDDIKKKLKNIECIISRSQSRYYIENYKEEDENKIIKKLQLVFGLYSISICYKFKTNEEEIKNMAFQCLNYNLNKKFRVNCKRADKSLKKTSIEISKEVGGYILSKRNDLQVDLHNYDFSVNIDIRENGFTYIYFNEIICQGGMPYLSGGHGMLLLSGGIDSPVAGYMMAKRGMKLTAIHFSSPPYTSELAKQKVVELATKLTNYINEIDLYVIPFTKIQMAIHKYSREDFMITVMRRIMVKIAKKLSDEIGCKCLITGESLGQVASQTLESLISTQESCKEFLILRPLIAFDKTDIIKISKNIDCFDISSLQYEDCCTIFLPKKPIIKPILKDSIDEENKIKNIDLLIDEALNNKELIKIKN